MCVCSVSTTHLLRVVCVELHQHFWLYVYLYEFKCGKIMAYILLITGWAENITECIYEHVLAVSIVMDCERNVLYLWGRAH